MKGNLKIKEILWKILKKRLKRNLKDNILTSISKKWYNIYIENEKKGELLWDIYLQ